MIVGPEVGETTLTRLEFPASPVAVRPECVEVEMKPERIDLIGRVVVILKAQIAIQYLGRLIESRLHTILDVLLEVRRVLRGGRGEQEC
jgi:hypothetical protein